METQTHFRPALKPVGQARRRRDSRSALILLAPALILVTIWVVFPILYAGFLALFTWDGAGTRQWIGLTNYSRIITDNIFWHSLANNLWIALVALVFQVFIGLIIAYCLVRIIPQVKRLYLFFYMVPVVISEICIGLLWSFVYNPSFGLLNGVLKALGMEFLTHGWLGDRQTAFIAVLITLCMTYLGLYVLLFVSAMQNISEDMFEAAKLDGCSNIRMFFSIAVPSISDSIQSTALLAIITSFKTFSLIWILTGGGPNQATEVVSTYLYKTGFLSFDSGYAATIGFTQMVLTALAGLVVMRALRRIGGTR